MSAPRKVRKYPAETRETAIALSAGSSTREAAAAVGLSQRTVRRWRASTDTATLEKLVQEKQMRARRIVLERLESAVTSVMDGVSEPLDYYGARALQARATALGILDDHFGVRNAPVGRFGSEEPFPGEVVETAERITRRYRR